MLRRCVTIPGILMLLPLISAQETQPEAKDETKASAPGADETEQLGARILNESREILKLLTSVTDRDSADKAAGPLREKLKALDTHLRELETLPFTDEQDARAIHGDMTELTHLSQAELEILHRLQGVGAYGSQALLDVFEQYKFGQDAAPALQADDLPHSQLSTQLADEIEDALYTLRKVQDESHARDAANTVEDMLGKIERTHNLLTQLAAPRTVEQREALEPARERLRHLSSEARKVHELLRQNQFFGEPKLSDVMERLIRATVP